VQLEGIGKLKQIINIAKMASGVTTEINRSSNSVVNSSNNNTLCLRCAELELKRIQLELKSADEIVKLLLKEEINNSEKSEVSTHSTQTETDSDKLAINQWYKVTKKYKKKCSYPIYGRHPLMKR
jgi:hypothetical protein